MSTGTVNKNQTLGLQWFIVRERSGMQRVKAKTVMNATVHTWHSMSKQDGDPVQSSTSQEVALK